MELSEYEYKLFLPVFPTLAFKSSWIKCVIWLPLNSQSWDIVSHHLRLSPYHYKLQRNNISNLSLLLHLEWPSRTMNRWWGDVATLNKWSGVALKQLAHHLTTLETQQRNPMRLDREILVKTQTICPPWSQVSLDWLMWGLEIDNILNWHPSHTINCLVRRPLVCPHIKFLPHQAHWHIAIRVFQKKHFFEKMKSTTHHALAW